jgi:hypothetical protein
MVTQVPDFSTPEGAVIALEDAYRRRDLEAAVQSKDFKQDAFYFLGLQFGSDLGRADEMGEALEANFRREMADGLPDYSKIKTSFIKREVVSPEQVILTQRCQRGEHVRDMRLLVVKTDRGWRTVLAPGFDRK